ncbi:four helix bundle protein [Arenibacter sp. M-2]|mgnify:CR=1 FL=1|uniref:four helix bundle protein n=1 Tax=Arenibacter sp. M-2 TaxID=3053612 RepID=UPI00256FA775|nr:four helix bundle protein [Arenibacter sp. M-2]MDL5510182.1 four helix bundle protein [Arenibacter sp. M-2]|tara:strand:- start:80 stop:457 length:378 start_codon:yes stop_codon:yes gene_type:complete
MAKINLFGEINAWKESIDFNKVIYDLTIKGEFEKYFDLKRQIRRASVSISSNIAEGFERNTNREFIHFLYISKASAGEVGSQLYLALDLGHLEEKQFILLKEKIENISIMLSGFIKNWISRQGTL